jgi:RHS repeat-associated protein
MGTWSYGYDDNGNLTSQTDAKAVTLEFTYDALSRMTLKKIAGSTTALATYYYDEPDHDYGIGRRSRVTYYRGTLWYNYDPMGRVTDQYRQIGLPVMQQIAGAPPPGTIRLYHIATTFDYVGRVKTTTYPMGEVVTNNYDAAGRLVSVGGYVTNATYDARDNLLTRTLANGVVESFTYDQNRFWLTRNKADKGTTLHDVGYGRNLRGEVTSRANALVAQDQWTFGYDDLRRLTTATSIGEAMWSQNFAYDSIGRMTSQTGVGTYSYPATGSRPIHAPATIGANALVYDANGRLTSGLGDTIDYDAEGRAYIGCCHGYDADGELVTYKGVKFMSNLYEEDSEFLIKTNYYYFGETRIARKRNDTVHYYLGDQIGSTSVMTDDAGTVVSRKVFSPFGKLLLQSGGLNDDPFGFAAQRMEFSGSSLYHMGARRMSPGAGIFVMPDPSAAPDASRPQTLNRFSYANNSPTNLIDPTGYEAEEPKESATPVPQYLELNLNLTGYLDAIENGIWMKAPVLQGYKNNREVNEASRRVAQTESTGEGDIVASQNYIDFVRQIAAPTGNARYNETYGKAEKILGLNLNDSGEVQVSRIALKLGQGGSNMSGVLTGAVAMAHVHYTGLETRPGAGDSSFLKVTNRSAFVITDRTPGHSSCCVAWEIGRTGTGENYKYRSISGSEPGAWRKMPRTD